MSRFHAEGVHITGISIFITAFNGSAFRVARNNKKTRDTETILAQSPNSGLTTPTDFSYNLKKKFAKPISCA